MSNKSFYHSGDIGDVLYGLLVVQRMGGGQLWLGPRNNLGPRFQPRAGIGQREYIAVVQLIAKQPYIEYIDYAAYPPYVVNDLNKFRWFWRGDYSDKLPPGRANLQHMHLAAFGIPVEDETEPWLVCGKKRAAAVVIARSPRYHNWRFKWDAIIAKYKQKACFVGLPSEYAAFVNEFPEAAEIRYVETKTLLELAEIINACDLFVGNQSSPYAIAEGLKKNTIQETRIDVEHDIGADCVFDRPNAQYVRDTFEPNLPDL